MKQILNELAHLSKESRPSSNEDRLSSVKPRDFRPTEVFIAEVHCFAGLRMRFGRWCWRMQTHWLSSSLRSGFYRRALALKRSTNKTEEIRRKLAHSIRIHSDMHVSTRRALHAGWYAKHIHLFIASICNILTSLIGFEGLDTSNWSAHNYGFGRGIADLNCLWS